jgi:large subunit ribosomal protein L29
MAVGISAAELRTSTEDELVTKLREAKEELFNLRFQAATGQLESHGRLRGVRREIARIYTVMRERELGIVTVEEGAPEEAGAEDTASAEAAEDAAPARTRTGRLRRSRTAPDAAPPETAQADAGPQDETGTDEAAEAAAAEEPDTDE